MTTITIHNAQGVGLKNGVDSDGNRWMQFEVDYLAEQEDGECCICGEVLSEGWMCLDGGDEVCNRHIHFPGE